jgi:ABC-type sugar transport system permease subunit
MMNRPSLTTWRRLATILVVLLISAAALGLRLRATQLLPIDYDEDDYLGAAQRYAQFLAAGDVRGLVDYAYNYEHPPLTKLLYGAAILPLPPAPLLPERPSTDPPAKSLPQPHFRIARTVSAVLGALEVLALTILQPLAGLLLAVHTWTIKYTSQVMLEPLPSLTSLLTVLFYINSRRSRSSGRIRAATGWSILSAVALGLTAASKYTYCIVALAIAADAVWLALAARSLRDDAAARTLRDDAGALDHPLRAAIFELLLWGLIALAIFFAANPRLWSDPFGRLAQSLRYHGEYAQSAHVQQYNFPFWQPLVYLLGPVPWHPGVFVVMLDTFITVLAGLGLGRLWREYRVCALWLAIGLGFLLVWPTKWPQYILTITAPLSLAAGLGFRAALWEPLLRSVQRRRADGRTAAAARHAAAAQRVARRDARRAIPWLTPGIIALSLLALFPLIYQAAVALTDFNAISIRDGIQGGVWRAVRQGLTGQAQPVAVGIFESVTRTKEVHWAGPSVLIQLLGGAEPDLLAFNLLWAALSVSLQAVLGVAAALMLHRRGVRGRNVWRTIFILPWAIPEFVGALIWLRILEPGFGWLALAQGIPADALRAQAVAGPNATLVQLLVAATWYGFPLIMLAATASLKLTPDEVYDAAAMDGAVGWQRFRWITWPLMLPLLAPALFVRGIFAFNQFYLFYTMRVEPPTITLATASYYLFTPTGYFGGQFAVSAAINIFTVLVLLGLILWLARLTRGEATEEVTYA